MKTGIISDAYYTFDNYQQGMPIMKAHGYDSIDYQGFGSIKNSPLYKMSDGELERYLTDMRECAKANGLGIHQLHGAWPHVDDFTAEGRAKTVEYFKMNILGAKMLGCPRVVIHPLMPKLGLDDPYDEEEDFEVNGLVLETLAPVARENGVTVCFENMPFLRQTCFSRIKNINPPPRLLPLTLLFMKSDCFILIFDVEYMAPANASPFDLILLLVNFVLVTFKSPP